MAKALSIEDQLAALNAVKPDPASEVSKAQLTKALSNKINLVVAKAATIITDSHQADLLPALAAAFDRLMVAGSDKGCLAKTALSNGLYTLGHNDPAPFLRGIHYIQMEPSFGKPVDAAAELRGICALGLARMGYPDVLLELAEVLVDAEPQTRQVAVRAVAYTGSEDGAPLLRMKALAGDTEPEITAECFVGLMKLSPKKSLEFVGRFLKSPDPALSEAAALAIGGWRTAASFEYLRAEWESHVQPDPRRPLLSGIAMTRQPAAIEFLLQRVADDRPVPASDAVAALAIYKHDETVKARVSSLVDQVGDLAVTTAFKKAFSSG